MCFKDVKFWWEKNKVTFDGQTGEETLESEVRIKSISESAGEGKGYESNIYIMNYRNLFLPCEK